MFFSLIAAFIGFSEGIVVGSALVAFITLLDIVPRLAQLTSTENRIKLFEIALILGAFIMTLTNSLDMNIRLSRIMVALIGGFMGIYVGLLASALAEVTNVIPVFVNRFKINHYVKYIFMSLAGGKVVGSLIYWLVIKK